MKIKKPNREQVREPKGGTFWCMGCDEQLVHETEKCLICGFRSGSKRGKKGEKPLKIEEYY